jgi:hypothetical protein
MNHELPPEEEPIELTRRAALFRALAVGVAAATLPATVSAAPAVPTPKEPEFVPENDYPFFGSEPK